MPFKNSQAMFNVYERMTEQIEQSVERAVNFYYSECNRQGLKTPSWYHGDIKSVNSVYVTVEWDIYARSCRVAGGIYDIPVAALCDDTYQETITKIVSDEVFKQNEKIRVDKERELKYKREQLQKLKDELGE